MSFLIFPLYIATRCLYVWPISSGTAGPIWLNFFLLAPSWSQGGFRPKNPNPESSFSGNPEKIRFLRYYLTNLAEIFRIYSS